MKRFIYIMLTATAALASLTACGGGGGQSGPTANVRGRIMLVGTGQPLAAATVRVGGQSVVTGATGEFQFSGVPVTPSPQLEVSAQGIKTLTQTVPELTPAQANDLGDIFVVDDTGSYTANVKGTVVNAENFEPIGNATVTISGLRVKTSANGAFQLSNLPVGLGGTSVPVGTITAQGFETKTLLLDLPLGASPPDNDLGPIAISPPVGTIPGGPFNIRGTVSQVGVQDMTGTIVSLIRKSDNQTVDSVTTGANGFYGFWVVAGDYTVKAERGTAVKTADATLVRIDQPITVNMAIGGP